MQLVAEKAGFLEISSALYSYLLFIVNSKLGVGGLKHLIASDNYHCTSYHIDR